MALEVEYAKLPQKSEVWDVMVGSQTIKEFLEYSESKVIDEAVDEYIAASEFFQEYSEDDQATIRSWLIEYMEEDEIADLTIGPTKVRFRRDGLFMIGKNVCKDEEAVIRHLYLEDEDDVQAIKIWAKDCRASLV